MKIDSHGTKLVTDRDGQTVAAPASDVENVRRLMGMPYRNVNGELMVLDVPESYPPDAIVTRRWETSEDVHQL